MPKMIIIILIILIIIKLKNNMIQLNEQYVTSELANLNTHV